jgi:glycosyltransferase involved in cell wall biosynthesis
VLDDDRTTHWSGLRARILNLAMRLASDRAIVLAGRLEERFARQSGIARARIVVVPNGIRPWPEAGTRRAELRRRLGWSEHRKVVLLVAVLRGGKGHEDMFAAMPEVVSAVPEVTLQIVGDGPARQALEVLARPLGDRVAFLGERSDVPDLMAAADLLVLPSWSEAYPTVLLEAAMTGLPAVATDVGGSAEIVSDSATGLIVPPHAPDRLAAAIVAVLGDGDLAHSLGRAARRRAETEFSVTRQAERTLAVYSGLVSPARHAISGAGPRLAAPD